MRPLLITDGAHLKGTYKDTSLVLVRMDGNNQTVPIATGVSQGETEESWTWFLLKFNECIGEVLNLAIITNKHPAIILACNTIFPNAFHRYCCRHLMMNCKMKSDKLQAIYWKTCKAYTPEEFQRRVSDLGGFRPEVYKKLEEAGFETWSRAIAHDWANGPNAKERSLKGIPCGHVIAVSRKIGCTDCSHLALGWFRKTTLYSTYQDLVYPVGEPSSCVRPYGLQVVKPPNMNFRTAGRPKNTDRIKSQGEEPIQDSTQPRLKRSRQIRQESNIHVDLGGHSQEYEAAYTNNYVRSQEYEAAYTNNYVRSQEYEAAYTNNYVRSQEYEATYTNNYVRSQEYEAAYTNNYVSTQEYEVAYNNMDGGSQGYQSTYNNMNGSLQGYEVAYTNFNNMFEQANINFGGQSEHPLPTMPFTFSSFNLGQSSQQTYSTWDASWDLINLADP
ncbi:transposase, MuDR, MULE transposase domain protein [Tanacetum coccineum]